MIKSLPLLLEVFLPFFLGCLAIAAIFLGIYGLFYAAHAYDERQRTKTIKALADTWGFEYKENPKAHIPDPVLQFKFFNYGRDRTIKNLIQGQQGDVTISIADYYYVTGSSSKHAIHHQTFILAQSPHLQLPNFMLMSASRFEKLAFRTFGAFPYREVQVKGHPKFSSRYLLGGSDRTAIQNCFQDGVLSLFEHQEKKKRVYSEGIGSFLLKSSLHRVPPKKWKGLINEALELHEQFVQH